MSDDSLIIIDEFQVQFNPEAIAAKMGSRRSAKVEKTIATLAREAQAVARPVAGAKMSSVTLLSDEQSSLDGIAFSSALLREKLEGLGRAFPFLASEGRELTEWAGTYRGSERIFADSLEKEALYQVRERLEAAILEKYGLEMISAMNPGSLRIWPIMEQAPLFQLLGPLPERLGIKLLPSFMMEPQHSVSGIFFQTSTKYHNCQLCPKEECPNRKAPYTGMS